MHLWDVEGVMAEGQELPQESADAFEARREAYREQVKEQTKGQIRVR